VCSSDLGGGDRSGINLIAGALVAAGRQTGPVHRGGESERPEALDLGRRNREAQPQRGGTAGRRNIYGYGEMPAGPAPASTLHFVPAFQQLGSGFRVRDVKR